MLAAAGAATLWGTSIVATKPILLQTPPVLLTFTRFLIAAVVLTIFVCRGGKRPSLGRLEAMLGLTGISLFYICQNAALRTATATEATLLIGGGSVVLTALLGMKFLGERLSRWQWGGVLFGVAGIACVAWSAKGSGSGTSGWEAQLLLLLAAGCAALYWILGRRAYAGPDAVAAVAGSTILGTLFLFPIVACEVGREGLVMPGGAEFGLLLYLAIGSSALGYVLSAYGLRHLTAAQNAMLGTLELPIGLAAAACFLGEGVGVWQAGGAVLVLIGTGLVAATVARQ
jgi:drug/metabolite transporter (DMT)-like permease